MGGAFFTFSTLFSSLFNLNSNYSSAMDESGMDPGSTPPAPSTHKYMSVPEKIELTSGGVRDGYSTGSEAWMDQSSYRPMNVRRLLVKKHTSIN